jgi:hypothetical protein
VGEYIAKDCVNLKQGCMLRGGFKSILGKINKHVGEGNKKMVQMKMLFHVLAHGSLMFEFETLYELFGGLEQSNCALVLFYWLVGYLMNLCTSK